MVSWCQNVTYCSLVVYRSLRRRFLDHLCYQSIEWFNWQMLSIVSINYILKLWAIEKNRSKKLRKDYFGQEKTIINDYKILYQSWPNSSQSVFYLKPFKSLENRQSGTFVLFFAGLLILFSGKTR